MEASLKFSRRIGAKADVEELKYISALLQASDDDLRPNCTLNPSDIVALLRSKFGLAITEEEVSDIILRGGLSTGNQCTVDPGNGKEFDANESSPSAVLDLCELVAALIIPDLLKIVQQNNVTETTTRAEEDGLPHNVLVTVLESITEAVLGQDDENDQDCLIINEDTVRQLLVSIGEVELAKNHGIIRSMVQQATGQGEILLEEGSNPCSETLNIETFGHALTSDIQQYCVANHADLIDQAKPNIFECCKRKTQNISVQTEELEDIQEAQQDCTNQDMPPDNDTLVIEKAVPEEANIEQNNEQSHQVKRIFTAPSIDYIADSQASRFIAISLWVFFLLHILSSGSLGLQDFPSIVPSDLDMCPSTPNVGCDTLEVFLGWVDTVFTIFIMGGLFIMLLGSLGNRLDSPRAFAVLISMIPALYYFIKPFTSIGTAHEDLMGDTHRQFALGSSLVVAALIICHRLKQFIYLFVAPKRWLESGSKLAKIVASDLTGTVHERHQAASHKINRMLCNACDITQGSKHNKDNPVITFYEKRDAQEKVGGHFWTWKRMRQRSLYCEEGVRFSARLVAANVMQFFSIMYIILFVMVKTQEFEESYDGFVTVVVIRSAESAATKMIQNAQSFHGAAVKAVDLTFTQVIPALESLRIESCEALATQKDNTTFVLPSICTNSTFLVGLENESEAYKELILATASQMIDPVRRVLRRIIEAGVATLSDMVVVFDPLEPWMIRMAFGIGGLVAFFASIFLATLYIPSVVSTTLKFRCGLIPSLTDPMRFSKVYRGNIHHTTFLTGALFWGTLLYCAGLAFVIGCVLLVLIWLVYIGPALVNAEAPGVPGMIIGSVVAFLVQYILFNIGTCKMYKSFYRRHPGWANIHSVLWEAAWVVLMILFVLMRAIKLIVVAALQVGRIDIPFLQDGVGVYGGVNLDGFPYIFRKDILAHEAHNHPFVERLSMIYLTKIRHRDSFANPAGTAWRMILVSSLFPWLRKYRVNSRCDASRTKSSACMEDLDDIAKN